MDPDPDRYLAKNAGSGSNECGSATLIKTKAFIVFCSPRMRGRVAQTNKCLSVKRSVSNFVIVSSFTFPERKNRISYAGTLCASFMHVDVKKINGRLGLATLCT